MVRLQSQAEGADPISERYERAFADTLYGEDFVFEIDSVAPKSGARFEGEVAVLVHRHSYSNAVSVAAIVQDMGFGAVVGQSTTDFATTYGAMETFKLEHSGFEVGFPKALIVRPSGDEMPGPVVVDRVLSNLDNLTDIEIAVRVFKD